MIHDQSVPGENEFQEVSSPSCVYEISKLMVFKLVDGYFAEMVSGFSRPSYDGLHRAIDMYPEEPPGIGKSERKQKKKHSC